jgi:hypothetical protein
MQVCSIVITNGTTSILWICLPNTTDKTIKTIAAEVRKQQVGDTQLNQNSAGNHVNRDNFKLNVYENWHCKHFKNYYQNKFYTADSDEFYGSTIGSDGLLRNKQERLFTTNSDKAALSASVFV